MNAIDSQFKRAVERFGAKDFEGAEKACRKLLVAQPQHVDALHMLGMILGKAERRTEAVELLARAAAIRPGDAPLQNNLGEIYRQLERLEEAAGCFCRAIELAPRFAEPHYNLGIALKAWAAATRPRRRFDDPSN